MVNTDRLHWDHHRRVMEVLGTYNSFAYAIVEILVRYLDPASLRAALMQQLHCSEEVADLLMEQGWASYLALWHSL